jgi:hypothetical protein
MPQEPFVEGRDPRCYQIELVERIEGAVIMGMTDPIADMLTRIRNGSAF